MVELQQIPKGALIPAFRLPSTEGRNLGPREFKQRNNLILAFLHEGGCGSCRTLLTTLAQSYQHFQGLNTEILAIVGGDKKIAEDLHCQMRLPFPFLFDPAERTAALCLGEHTPRPAILVADRYGGLWARLLPLKDDGIIDVKEVLQWLEFIETQCPECNVPDLPPPA